MFEHVTSPAPEIAAHVARCSTRLDELEEMECGPTQLAGMHALRGECLGAANACRLDRLWDKHISWANAQRLLTTDEVAYGLGQLPGVSNAEAQILAAAEIAAATHQPLATARAQVRRMTTIRECMPKVWTAMDRGELSLDHVKALEQVTEHATPRVTQAVTDQVVPLAIEHGWTPSELRNAARKALLEIDPDGAKQRAADKKKAATVEFTPDTDDTASLWANGDAATTRRMFDTLNLRAEQMSRAGDERPVGARRFDALADAVLNRGTTSKKPVAQAFLHIDLETYLGLNDSTGRLDGYGPITADAARALADDANLWRLITDPMTGRGIDLGRRSYRPSRPLVRLVRARHEQCGMVGCTRPPISCEIDHRREYPDGPTDANNLGPLCKLHHELKTKKRWRVDVNPDGSETFTSALGFTYTKRAPKVPIELLQPPDDDEVPEDLAEVIPINPNAPPVDVPTGSRDDLMYDGIPLPVDPPAISDQEIDELETALDTLSVMGLGFREYANRIWDEARAIGLVG